MKKQLLLIAILFVSYLAEMINAQCDEPVDLKATSTNTNPTFYGYTGNSPPIVITPNELITDPPGCPISYTCSMDTPFDLCTYNTASVTSSFDTDTGIYTLASSDVTDPPDNTIITLHIMLITAQFGPYFQ